MHYYLACIYVTSAKGLFTKICIWFYGRSQYENNICFREMCWNIFVLRNRRSTCSYRPFEKPNGFKTSEFGCYAKHCINNKVLSMIVSTNKELYFQTDSGGQKTDLCYPYGSFETFSSLLLLLSSFIYLSCIKCCNSPDN